MKWIRELEIDLEIKESNIIELKNKNKEFNDLIE